LKGDEMQNSSTHACRHRTAAQHGHQETNSVQQTWQEMQQQLLLLLTATVNFSLLLLGAELLHEVYVEVLELLHEALHHLLTRQKGRPAAKKRPGSGKSWTPGKSKQHTSMQCLTRSGPRKLSWYSKWAVHAGKPSSMQALPSNAPEVLAARRLAET
jgi:hypothetical protein